MDGMEDMRQRVARLETEMSDLSSKVGGAVADIASMRSAQDGIGNKIDTLISSVAELKARPIHEPADIIDVTSKVISTLYKGAGLIAASVAALFFLFQSWQAQTKTQTASAEPSAYVVIQGKRYQVSR